MKSLNSLCKDFPYGCLKSFEVVDHKTGFVDSNDEDSDELVRIDRLGGGGGLGGGGAEGGFSITNQAQRT